MNILQDLEVSTQILETGAAVKEMNTKIHHTFPLSVSEIKSVLCLTRRDKSITCQMLLSGVDNSILFVQVPGTSHIKFFVYINNRMLSSWAKNELCGQSKN